MAFPPQVQSCRCQFAYVRAARPFDSTRVPPHQLAASDFSRHWQASSCWVLFNNSTQVRRTPAAGTSSFGLRLGVKLRWGRQVPFLPLSLTRGRRCPPAPGLCPLSLPVNFKVTVHCGSKAARLGSTGSVSLAGRLSQPQAPHCGTASHAASATQAGQQPPHWQAATVTVARGASGCWYF